MDLWTNILEKHEYLTPSEVIIVDYLLKNKKDILYVTSTDIAKQLGISHSTLSRFWNKIGYENIKAFKQALKKESNTTPASKLKNTISKLENSDNSMKEIILRDIYTIEKTLEHITSSQINNAANLILAKKKRYIYAPDVSMGIAEILKYRLKRFGIEFFSIQGGSSIYEDLINISKEDLVLLFSYSKILPESSILLDYKKKVNYSLITFTDLLVSPINDISNITLYNYRGDPTEYHSAISSISIIDCLILKIALCADDYMRKMDKLNDVRNMYSNYIKR
ncbi:MurR/RpiR family transcriptional regulator [Clostridium sp. AWRP]|uniref:MurR/RpiR family transcriptional regulator n=1 Tax=Clostridium sp. AWRP TaxID=2212991 RepID=UPI0015867578|nr:MurR/RpiR family transcriptional regulator [Clostridium sp. AWRP]